MSGTASVPRNNSRPIMKHPLPILLTLLLASHLRADGRGALIFEDDFERSESQEEKDEPGKGWGTNSKSRAQGNKQVDLKDGAMHITFHPVADHAVSVTHPAEFVDGTVEMRFQLVEEKDVLGLNFADLQCKEVHAGHLFKVDFAAKCVSITDLKTGGMNMKYYDAKKAGKLGDEDKKLIALKTKKAPHAISVGEWHSLRVTIAGDTVTASVDGEEVVSFSSEGIAHPTKRLLRLSVPHRAIVDDVKIWAKTPIGG